MPTEREFLEMWAWGYLDDEVIRQGCKRFFFVDIPEGSTNIEIHYLDYRQVGEVEKFIPQNRFALGWPTYVKVVVPTYTRDRALIWDGPDGKTYTYKVV